MDVHFDIDLTPSQQEAYQMAHDKQVKYLTLVWSRQSGKSTLIELLCIEWLLTSDCCRIGYVCPSYLLCKKVFKEILSFLPKGTYRSANGSDLVITSKNGSSLQLFSAESGHALRGNTFDYLVLDEAAFFRMEQVDGSNLWFDILYPTTKVRGKKIIFVSTPLGKSNLFYEMFERGMSDEFPEYVSLKKTIYDDGLISPEEIEKVKKSIPSLSFRAEYLCEFLDNAVTFFSGFEKCLSEFTYADTNDVYIGIDFSSVGEDRTVVTKINGIGQVYQRIVSGTLDQRYREIAEIINTTSHLRSCLMESNSIGKPMGNETIKLLTPEARRKTKFFSTTNSSKDRIVSKLAVDIADMRITYNSHLLFDELGAFQCSYSKTGKPTYSGRGEHDDMVMSLAIANSERGSKTYVGGIDFVHGKNTLIE